MVFVTARGVCTSATLRSCELRHLRAVRRMCTQKVELKHFAAFSVFWLRPKAHVVSDGWEVREWKMSQTTQT